MTDICPICGGKLENVTCSGIRNGSLEFGSIHRHVGGEYAMCSPPPHSPGLNLSERLHKGYAPDAR